MNEALLTIAAMAAANYGLRAGGVLLAGRLPREGRLARAFARLPGIVLVSLIAPAVVERGRVGLLAALVTLAIGLRTRGLIPAMAGGVAAAALLRLI